VGRKYAGILGWLAFAMLLFRGMLAGSFQPAIIWQACCGLLIFAAVGGMAGMLANRFVTESVLARFAEAKAEQLAAAEAKDKARSTDAKAA
jgi:hypothetical protein